MNSGKWDARIRRAADLIPVYPFAAEGLRFYSRVAAFQQSLHAEVEQALSNSRQIAPAQSLRGELDLFVILPNFPKFLALMQQIAPSPLAQGAASLAQKGPAAWQQVLEEFLHSDTDWPAEAGAGEPSQGVATAPQSLLAWIFLQPYAEYLADRCGRAVTDGAPSKCPFCGRRPIVGVLRSEGDGAKKSLVCMLCAHEWTFRRIYCPACGEEREPQMAFFSAPEIAHVRVDVCDSCHTYLKSIDLTKSGLVVPIVDELATLPLDLWAREHGYEKLQINLLGI